MKRLFLSIAFIFFARLGWASGVDVKNVEDPEELRRGLSVAAQTFLPKAGGDTVFYIDRKNNQVNISTLTVTNLNPLFNYKVGTFAGKTSTGNQSVTGIGFKPRLVQLYRWYGGAAQAGYCMGMMTSTDQWGDGLEADDGGGTASFGPVSTSYAIICVDNGGSQFQRAAYVSMDSDGFTINWSVADGGGSTIAFVAYQ